MSDIRRYSPDGLATMYDWELPSVFFVMGFLRGTDDGGIYHCSSMYGWRNGGVWLNFLLREPSTVRATITTGYLIIIVVGNLFQYEFVFSEHKKKKTKKIKPIAIIICYTVAIVTLRPTVTSILLKKKNTRRMLITFITLVFFLNLYYKCYSYSR